MPVSQTTNILLKNGKEELKVHWDVSNGIIEIHRDHITEVDEKKRRRHSIVIRHSDLTDVGACEFFGAMRKAFEMIFAVDPEEMGVEWDEEWEEAEDFFEDDDDDDE